ncbi:unnamed protein product, partial [Amoebophrya sp. A25]
YSSRRHRAERSRSGDRGAAVDRSAGSQRRWNSCEDRSGERSRDRGEHRYAASTHLSRRSGKQSARRSSRCSSASHHRQHHGTSSHKYSSNNSTGAGPPRESVSPTKMYASLRHETERKRSLFSGIKTNEVEAPLFHYHIWCCPSLGCNDCVRRWRRRLGFAAVVKQGVKQDQSRGPPQIPPGDSTRNAPAPPSSRLSADEAPPVASQHAVVSSSSSAQASSRGAAVLVTSGRNNPVFSSSP